MPAIIFDMDGVLIDSEPFWQAAELEVFRPLGVPLTQAMTLETTGLRVATVVERWFARFPWKGPTQAEVASAIVERVEAQVRAVGEPIAGAVELVRAAHGRGFTLGLCSSSAKTLIAAVTEKLAIADCFAVRQSAEDCARGKPAPDPYLATAAALGVRPEDCVVLEDSLNGMRSAAAAGMAVVGFMTAPSAEARALCRFTISDFGELSPDRLAGLSAGPGARR